MLKQMVFPSYLQTPCNLSILVALTISSNPLSVLWRNLVVFLWRCYIFKKIGFSSFPEVCLVYHTYNQELLKTGHAMNTYNTAHNILAIYCANASFKFHYKFNSQKVINRTWYLIYQTLLPHELPNNLKLSILES